MVWDIYRPVSVSVFPKIDKRPDWTGLLNTIWDSYPLTTFLLLWRYIYLNQPSIHAHSEIMTTLDVIRYTYMRCSRQELSLHKSTAFYACYKKRAAGSF